MSSFSATRKTESKYGCSGTNTALAAVALQDHLMRNLSLRDPLLLNRQKAPQPKAKQWRKDARPTIDTGRGNAKYKKKPEIQEKEYVLDPKPPAPTLAQRMGLVDAPTQPLTEDEWKKAKEKSNKRDDSKQPCVICKEDFGVQEQVLLSCTHVFHRACLQAFERFTGRKTCPMCRKEQYQTRVIHEGARVHRHQCATKIQAAWRGYVVRCWYKKLRETNPPKDPKLRKKFYQEKLSSITDRMIRSLDYDVGGFLQEIDASIQASRDIMRQFEDATKQISEEDWEQIQLKAVERGNKECPICLTFLEEESLVAQLPVASAATSVTTDDDPKSKQHQILQHELQQKAKPTTTKTSIQLKTRFFQNRSHAKMSTSSSERAKNSSDHSNSAKPRDHSGPNNEGDAVRSTGKASRTNRRSTVLLSCSHVFHQTCLETFEEFAVGERRHLCPVCRTHYQKKVL